ncbi:hypothetical protein [Alistipes sp.]|uniref:hypothetical protein n=1 Tax=Alistipes sp. TaxID=1872444 RepID=UPI003AF027AD
MTTVHIEDNTPEGRFLIDLIKNHKSVTIVPDEEKPQQAGAWDKAVADGAVSLSEFNARFENQIRETYGQ